MCKAKPIRQAEKCSFWKTEGCCGDIWYCVCVDKPVICMSCSTRNNASTPLLVGLVQGWAVLSILLQQKNYVYCRRIAQITLANTQLPYKQHTSLSSSGSTVERLILNIYSGNLTDKNY